MIKEEKKRPAVRFEGFSDDWEVRKFGDLFKRRMERNNGQFDKTKWISVAKMYYQEANKVTSNNIDTRTYVLRLGDIAFEGHSNNEFKIGRFVANDIGDGVISELFPIYKHITPYDLSFWKYYINLENIMFPKLQRCIEISYTSSNKLDEKFFLKELTRVPALDEQKKIGDYLRKIDMLITLHQRKLDQVKTLKKYFLQNMFPAKGETVPKIRLKGFTGDWEQRKLSEITLKIGSGKTPLGGVKAYKESGIPLIRSQNINNDKVDLSDVVYIDFATDEAMSNSRVYKDDILLNITGASIGRSAVYTLAKRANVNQHVCIIRPVNEYNSKFIQMNLASDIGQTKIEESQAGGARQGLNFKQIGKMSFVFPRLGEQKQIGLYFQKIDDLITLHQRKLDQLQTLKKFMLQNLFI
ncbi:restriction endonuclease subunit S [Megasphaera massiliensis]|uniref:restriction endonuclease subunit S n=2 Tax=Megasphaera massiliensis TaxID=1232428 RepID=UPI0003F86671|nr:restriction endonuclease subunit S [Megasphaera massiliensis]MBS6256011.1 restriction endonuclease subunit S [Megasphaera sp.]